MYTLHLATSDRAILMVAAKKNLSAGILQMRPADEKTLYRLRKLVATLAAGQSALLEVRWSLVLLAPPSKNSIHDGESYKLALCEDCFFEYSEICAFNKRFRCILMTTKPLVTPLIEQGRLVGLCNHRASSARAFNLIERGGQLSRPAQRVLSWLRDEFKHQSP